MRSGKERCYNIVLFISLLLFTAGVLFNELTLMLISFVTLIGGGVLFYGHEARIENGKLILEWGLILKRRREISVGEIVDLIDANPNRYFVMAKYYPDILLLPMGIIAGGSVILGTEFPWVGLAWILIGGIKVITYLFPPAEKRRAALLTLVLTGIVVTVAYLIGTFIVPLISFGIVMAGIIWERGTVLTNTLVLVTEKGIYSVRYLSKLEWEKLMGLLGG